MDPKDPTDLLHGLPAIAAHLGISTRQAKYRAATGGLPTFRIGRTVCARRSTLNQWIADRETAAAKGSSNA